MNILWDRYAKITFKLSDETIVFERKKDVESADFTIDIDKDTTENSNIAKIEIWNIPIDLVKKLRRTTIVTIEAGYLNDNEQNKDVGVVYIGTINSVRGQEDGPNKKYEIICDTSNDEYKNTKINLKAGNNTKASTIINTVISKLDKLKVGEIKLKKDIIYKDGKTLHNNVKSIFKTMAKDCESIFYISDNKVYFLPTLNETGKTFELDINKVISITSNEDGFNIKTVFYHSLEEGSKLKIEKSNEYEDWTLKGEFPITKLKHYMSFRDDAYTEIEIKTKLEEKENEIEIKLVSPNKSGKKSTKKEVKK